MHTLLPKCAESDILSLVVNKISTKDSSDSPATGHSATPGPVRVAVAVPLESRDFYAGIHRFNHLYQNWRVGPHPGCLKDLSLLPHRSDAEGLIGQIDTPELVATVADRGYPAVSTNRIGEDYPFPCVIPDDERIGVLAAEYFLHKGYRSFAFHGPMHLPHSHSVLRAQGFCDRLEQQAGLTADIFSDDADTPEKQQALGEFLARQPKPLAVFAAHDAKAADVILACLNTGLRIPEEVAVLGCDNNIIFCHLFEVPQSSIEVDQEAMGYEAARLLADMMAGREPRDRVLKVPPTRVVERRSTDSIAVDDPTIAKALHYLKAHIDDAPRVADLAEATASSIRKLQECFRLKLNRTVSKEIQSVRIRRAQELLLKPSHSITDIARMMNFDTPGHFSRFFKTQPGQTPSDFRRLQG